MRVLSTMTFCAVLADLTTLNMLYHDSIITGVKFCSKSSVCRPKVSLLDQWWATESSRLSTTMGSSIFSVSSDIAGSWTLLWRGEPQTTRAAASEQAKQGSSTTCEEGRWRPEQQSVSRQSKAQAPPICISIFILVRVNTNKNTNNAVWWVLEHIESVYSWTVHNTMWKEDSLEHRRERNDNL